MSEETPSQALARELGPNATSELGLSVLRYVRRWEKSHNPHWIDLAVMVVTQAGQQLPPCLQLMVADVATRRLLGLEQAAGGPSVIKEEIIQMAFACMAYLIAQGNVEGSMTVKVAASHAANAVAAIYGPLYKASHLEKEYGKGRASKYSKWEALYLPMISEDSKSATQLLAEISKLPNMDPGNRRD
jgi:hypothetical protein